MKSIAINPISASAIAAFGIKMSFLVAALSMLSACAGIGTSVGISIPIGRIGSIGMSVGSGGQVSGSVGVGVGGGSVSVGASGQLPTTEPKKEEEKKP